MEINPASSLEQAKRKEEKERGEISKTCPSNGFQGKSQYSMLMNNQVFPKPGNLPFHSTDFSLEWAPLLAPSSFVHNEFSVKLLSVCLLQCLLKPRKVFAPFGFGAVSKHGYAVVIATLQFAPRRDTTFSITISFPFLWPF